MSILKSEQLNINNNTGRESDKKLNEIEVLPRNKLENEKIDKKFSLLQKFLAELIGSTILVYHCCGAAVFQKDKLYVAVFSSAFSVSFLIYCFINISGAHFNPVVSLPLYLKGSLTFKELNVLYNRSNNRLLFRMLFYSNKS